MRGERYSKHGRKCLNTVFIEHLHPTVLGTGDKNVPVYMETYISVNALLKKRFRDMFLWQHRGGKDFVAGIL